MPAYLLRHTPMLERSFHRSAPSLSITAAKSLSSATETSHDVCFAIFTLNRETSLLTCESVWVLSLAVLLRPLGSQDLTSQTRKFGVATDRHARYLRPARVYRTFEGEKENDKKRRQNKNKKNKKEKKRQLKKTGTKMKKSEKIKNFFSKKKKKTCLLHHLEV